MNPETLSSQRRMLRIRGLEDQRATDGRQRQRDDRRNRDSAREREHELGEQSARQAALKSDRHEDADQHDRHRDDRADEFPRRLDGGLQRRHTLG